MSKKKEREAPQTWEEKWREDRKDLHKKTEKEEEKTLAKARKKIRARNAGLTLALIGLLISTADKDGKVEYRKTQERASFSDIDHVNEQVSSYNTSAQGDKIIPLPRTATKADVADMMVVLAAKDVAKDVGDIVSPHIDKTIKASYTQTLKFITGSFDAMQPYLSRTTEEWAAKQSLDVYKILDKSTNRTGEKLKQILKQGYAKGTSYEHLVEEAVKKIEGLEEKGTYACVYTEGTRVMAEASAQAVIDKGFKRYRLSTVGDSRVCETCKALETQVFEFKDREPGVNFPPLHPMCRCTFYVVTEEEGPDNQTT